MAIKGVSLHIGLNRVDPAHYDGWDGQLFACENDTNYQEMLAKKNGFKPIKLLNEKATSANVISELKKLSTQLKSGDILLITYSGHGGSLPDLNKDEDDRFRNDETWCLYDRQMVDDELFECYSKFKAGVRILVFSDSCHSGTVSRVFPGREEIVLPEDMKDRYKDHEFKSRKMPTEKVGPTYKNNKAVYDPVLQKPSLNKDSVNAFVVLFAACQDDQTAKEWGEHGIFTAAIKELEASSFTNYQKLFDEIKKNVPERLQVPNLYKYGNAAFDFSTQSPFSIDGKAGSTNGGRKPQKKNPKKEVNERDVELIIHTNDRSKATRSRPAELTRSRAQEQEDGNLHYGIKEESANTAEAWDKAYEHYLSASNADKSILFIEPNIKSKYARIPDQPVTRGSGNKYLETWPPPEAGDTEFIWHLDDSHSQLRKACKKVTGNVEPFGKNFSDERFKIKIGHIDTGYLDHLSKPLHLKEELGVSFVKSEFGANKGKDKLNSGFPAEQDGHGCATLAILAGNKITNAADSYTGYTDYFGAIPFAEVIPIRICETVYNLFNANDVADGIDYAVDQGCEVITMSMAGYPTRRVADAVNRAYSRGVIVVTAAGNNWFKGVQKITPKAVMYPARFERVIAVAGACYNHLPYDKDANQWLLSRTAGGETMQGNWGPDSAMKTAVAAYTPNLPWATIRGSDKFFRGGGGTSSSTPQVAAAAALWAVHNREKIRAAGIEGNWKKVEAARKAIFRSASKSYPAYKKYYGNGIIRAFDALDNFNFDTELNSLRESPAARVQFGGLGQFIGQWFRGRTTTRGGAPVPDTDETLQEMLSLEVMQLLYRNPEDGGDEHLMKYAEILEFENEDAADFLNDPVAKKEFIQALKNSPNASEFLKGVLHE